MSPVIANASARFTCAVVRLGPDVREFVIAALAASNVSTKSPAKAL